ncbi:MAG TPA: UDP-3-O-(3-hydroxymyristoyl)glucosamine N-acyltransferase [Kiritimatiellia bacterium]|nr:UDP-3-O-(3-hydroxymyristoyl)glucosamine N-acyltransferase [Kiritimatiellia bacterium]HMO99104.1 UDP-3-O-(3-hydroxymyristoyl)glucosamine N-acyltransferase [Kiritimatiellia bacterium]HMP96938.1 UDP-3-O-(3-hydroxymyristoyl)glucosamine N-acyltransferase [Kiritimatiellia bacterium]
MKTYTASDLARTVEGTLIGNPDRILSGIEHIEKAGDTHLTFIGSRSYLARWQTSGAGAALISEELEAEPGPGRALIRVKNADLALALALALFELPAPVAETGIHPDATVHPTAQIGENVIVGAGCYVGASVRIGPGAKLYPNVTVLDETVIGAQCVLWPGVIIRERCVLGNGVILQPNVAIGGDGFGYRPSPDRRSLVKIPHIGNVVIEDGVEIGANSTVDRGKFSATVIGAGTKIDNLVQIGHNCRIGRCCVIAACTGVAGSVTMGDGVMCGGCVAIKDHVTIGSGVRIGGGSGITGDIAPGQTVVGYPAEPHQQTLRQWAALKKLPDFMRDLKRAATPG